MKGGVDEGGAETSRGEAIDLSRLGRLLWRRRRWIVVPTLACAAAALVAVTTISPRYTGVAKVLLENQESYFTRPDKAVGTEPSADLDPEGVQSQAETVATTELARKAVDRLQLAQRVEFNPPEPTNPVAIVWSLLTGGRAGRPEDRLVDAFLSRLTVFPVAKSRVLQIEFSAAIRRSRRAAPTRSPSSISTRRSRPSATRRRRRAPGCRPRSTSCAARSPRRTARSRRFAPVPACSPAPTA